MSVQGMRPAVAALFILHVAVLCAFAALWVYSVAGAAQPSSIWTPLFIAVSGGVVLILIPLAKPPEGGRAIVGPTLRHWQIVQAASVIVGLAAIMSGIAWQTWVPQAVAALVILLVGIVAWRRFTQRAVTTE